MSPRLTRYAKGAMQIALALPLGNAWPAPVVQPPVEVNATRDAVEKSYRRIVRGMDLFEERHGLAPKAALRFRLVPRNRDTSMEGIALGIVGETVRIPVAVAADNTFALERSQAALDEDAFVIPNRKARTMTWRTDIRTPGLPPDTRRLGDLRLECRVGIEADLVSNARSIIQQLARLATDHAYCDQRVPEYLFFAERPLWNVTLVDGSRREALPVEDLYAGSSRRPMTGADLEYCDCEVLLDRTYYAPIGDPRWPDDTLLAFEYMDERPSSAAPTESSAANRMVDAVVVGKTRRADALAALGEATVVRFETGFEVWAYRFARDDPGGQGLAQLIARMTSLEDERETTGEFVILFAPSGVAVKTRIRLSEPRR